MSLKCISLTCPKCRRCSKSGVHGLGTPSILGRSKPEKILKAPTSTTSINWLIYHLHCGLGQPEGFQAHQRIQKLGTTLPVSAKHSASPCLISCSCSFPSTIMPQADKGNCSQELNDLLVLLVRHKQGENSNALTIRWLVASPTTICHSFTGAHTKSETFQFCSSAISVLHKKLPLLAAAPPTYGHLQKDFHQVVKSHLSPFRTCQC